MKLLGLDGYMTQTQPSYWVLINVFSVQLKTQVHLYHNRTIWGLLMASTFNIALIVMWVNLSHRLLTKIRLVVEEGMVRAKAMARVKAKMIIDEGCKDHSISIYRVRRFT